MSKQMTPTTQWGNIKPMLFFVALMVMMFGLSSTVSALALVRSWQTSHDNGVGNSGTRRHLLRMVSPGVLSGSQICRPSSLRFPVSSHTRGLFYSLRRSPPKFPTPRISASLATTGETISKRFMTTVFRQRLQLSAGGTSLAFYPVHGGMLCGHGILQNIKAPGQLLCCHTKRAQGQRNLVMGAFILCDRNSIP